MLIYKTNLPIKKDITKSLQDFKLFYIYYYILRYHGVWLSPEDEKRIKNINSSKDIILNIRQESNAIRKFCCALIDRKYKVICINKEYETDIIFPKGFWR